eukprot:scaffold70824_cov60-Phaeocystis_antarctica.AAC.3
MALGRARDVWRWGETVSGQAQGGWVNFPADAFGKNNSCVNYNMRRSVPSRSHGIARRIGKQRHALR